MKIGKKNDNGKDRWDLLPIGTIEQIVEVLTFGTNKYCDNNWQKVNNGKERYFAALMRHLVAYRKGEFFDKESGLPHLAHAGCCLIFIMWIEDRQKGIYENQ